MTGDVKRLLLMNGAVPQGIAINQGDSALTPAVSFGLARAKVLVLLEPQLCVPL